MDKNTHIHLFKRSPETTAQEGVSEHEEKGEKIK